MRSHVMPLSAVLTAVVVMLAQSATAQTALTGSAPKAAAVVVSAATPPPPTNVTGLLTGMTGANLSVTVSGAAHTVVTNDLTVFTVSGRAAARADLKPGMRVSCNLVSGVATRVVATIPLVSVAGTITAVTGGNVTVQTAKAIVTFATDASSKVTVDGKAATPANLKAGMKVTATTGLGVALTAKATIPKVVVAGEITDTAGGVISVKTAKSTASFTTDANTKVTVAAAAATPADLKASMKVTATVGLGVGITVSAKIPNISVVGLITDITDGNVTIQTATVEVVIQTDADTKVTVAAKAATVADLKEGMRVTSVTQLGTAATIKATIPLRIVVGTITDTADGIDVDTATGTATFATDGNTKVTIAGKAAAVGDLKLGMHVLAGTALGVAKTVKATIPVVSVKGTILSITGASILVQTATTPVTITTDAATKFTVAGKPGTLADLSAGMTLTASTKLGLATTITAQ